MPTWLQRPTPRLSLTSPSGDRYSHSSLSFWPKFETDISISLEMATPDLTARCHNTSIACAFDWCVYKCDGRKSMFQLRVGAIVFVSRTSVVVKSLKSLTTICDVQKYINIYEILSEQKKCPLSTNCSACTSLFIPVNAFRIRHHETRNAFIFNEWHWVELNASAQIDSNFLNGVFSLENAYIMSFFPL